MQHGCQSDRYRLASPIIGTAFYNLNSVDFAHYHIFDSSYVWFFFCNVRLTNSWKELRLVTKEALPSDRNEFFLHT